MAIRSMGKIYPHLDLASCYQVGDKALVAGIHTGSAISAPRHYAQLTNVEIVIFDGVPLAANGAFHGFDAAQLQRHWENLPATLEGQFCVARIRLMANEIELMVDPLGVYQLYYSQTPGGWLISNSVELLSRIVNNQQLDSLGAQYFLGLGWTASDRTLRDGVRVVPGGELWRWHGDNSTPTRKHYFRLADLAGKTSANFTARAAQELGDSLSKICRELPAYQTTVECPITAGRDSRMLTALMFRNHVEADYFSSGPASSPDVTVGSAIAHSLGLTHRAGDQNALSNEAVLSQWTAASERLLRQTDGMVTLAHITNAMGHPHQIAQLKLHLYGAAGEIARPFFLKDRMFFYLLEQRPAAFADALIGAMIDPKKQLLRADILQTTAQYIRDFTRAAIEQGFSTKDLDAVFYTQERVRRWAGANFRQVSSFVDVFAPLATRPYLEAAFSVPAYQRYCERIPRELLRYLAPQLETIPMELPWHRQTLMGLLLDYAVERGHQSIPARAMRKLMVLATGRQRQPGFVNTKGDQRQVWLEARLSEFRSLCFDQTNSPIWDFVDRPVLEHLLAPNTAAAERQRHLNTLYDIFTLFQYTSPAFTQSDA